MRGSGFSRASFGEQTVGKFSGVMDQSYRLSFPWWPGLIDPESNLIIPGGGSDMETQAPEFRMSESTIYVQGIGHIQDPQGELSRALRVKASRRYGTLVIKWPTNKKGTVDKERLSRGQYQILSWAFNERRFNDIGMIHRENGLGYFDLIAKCVHQNYQYFELSASKMNLFQQIKQGQPDLYNKIESEVAAAAENIYESIAKTMNLEQIESIRRRQ